MNLVKILVKMPKKAGKSGPPEVQKYQKVSLSHPRGEEVARNCDFYSPIFVVLVTEKTTELHKLVLHAYYLIICFQSSFLILVARFLFFS